jgi:glycosyltransferase involved in cell wall biosynthesis
MKIGFICHDAFPIAEPFQGGLEMITSLLVNELVRRGHSVTSLCLTGSQLNGEMLYYVSPKGNDEDSDYELSKLTAVSKSLTDFLLKDFDVVQNHSLHYQAIILGNLSSQKFVTTFHTPIFPFLDVGINVVAEHPYQHFVGVSKSVSRLYENVLSEVQTIYNGIDLDLWQPNYDNYQNYFSWCGRICKEKGLAEILELCLEENITLKFAGPISDKNYFTSNIEPFLKLGNFEYVGHLCQNDLNNFIAQSKAYIFSSIWEEPYGLVISEALACGVPVLANSVGAAPEILDSSSGFLFHLYKP